MRRLVLTVVAAFVSIPASAQECFVSDQSIQGGGLQGPMYCFTMYCPGQSIFIPGEPVASGGYTYSECFPLNPSGSGPNLVNPNGPTLLPADGYPLPVQGGGSTTTCGEGEVADPSSPTGCRPQVCGPSVGTPTASGGLFIALETPDCSEPSDPPPPGPGERIASRIRGLVCDGTLDINFNFTAPLPKFPIVGAGLSGGILVSRSGVWPYFGFNAGSTGVNISVTRSGTPPSPGLQFQYSFGLAPVGVGPTTAVGYTAESFRRGEPAFGEAGLVFGTPVAAGAQLTFVFDPIADNSTCK